MTKKIKKNDNRLVLQWLGTAGFRICFSGKVVLIDPFLSRNARAVPLQELQGKDMADADYIFLSHGHFDHIADIPEIARESGAEVFCSQVAARTLSGKGVPGTSIRMLGDAENIRLDGFSASTVACRHIIFDLKLLRDTIPGVLPEFRELLPRVRGMPAGPVLVFTFRFGEVSVMHIGSLGLTPELVRAKQLSSPDILLIALQGHSDICRRAAETSAALGPRAVVPQHHDDFFPPISQMIDIEPFRQLVEEMIPDCAYYEPAMNKEFGAQDIWR